MVSDVSPGMIWAWQKRDQWRLPSYAERHLSGWWL